MGQDEVVHAVVEALYDAADDDSATGGPDMVRGLMPSIFVVTGAGTERMDDEAVTTVASRVITQRQEGSRS
jgi:proteasome beta subunit